MSSKSVRGCMFAFLAAFLLANLVAPVRVSAGQTTGTLKLENELLRGQSLENRPLLYAPPFLALGSSISHWDTTATPNLLMEPFINPDLPFGALDITPLLMQDIGWQPGTSMINIIDGDEEGTGFTDPRPFGGAPGNDAETLGEARQNLIAALLDAWASELQSDVPIDVLVFWVPLPCDVSGAALAGASALVIFQGDEFPEPATWYHSALAEALAGQNLTGDPNADGDADILVFINSDIDEGCLGEGTGFYYGLDGEETDGLVDLAPVIVHEVAHGLGFSNFTDETNGEWFLNTPSIFDHFTFDQTLGRSWLRTSASERRFSATNDKNVIWTGPVAGAGSDDLLEAGAPVLELSVDTTLFVTPGVMLGSPFTAEGTMGGLACAFDELGVNPGVAPELPSIRDACDTLTNPQELAGNLVIVDRGNCSFELKALNVQAAGGVGLLIINSSDANLAPQGTDNMDVTIPVAGLRASQGDFLRSLACPVGSPANLVFAQWVNGESDGQENSIRVILRNQLPVTDSGTISFLGPSGDLAAPAESAIEPIPYEVSPFGTFDLQTTGTGPLQHGAVEVRSSLGADSFLIGSEIFHVLGKPVSVPQSFPGAGHSIYVTVDDSENTGMAFFNPDPELWLRILLLLFDDEGVYVDATTLELAPRQQVIGFVNEPDFFQEALADLQDGFKGTLDARVDVGPDFAMLGLIQQADGSLIATDTIPLF